MDKSKGNLFVISGPSGVGKSTICREVLKRMSNVRLSVSATTRTIGKGEVDGVNYFYISKEQFEQMIRNDEFLEYANVYGNYYGTPKKAAMEFISKGESLILEIDVQGGMQVKKVYDEAVLIFIMPPQQEELQKRLLGRARGEDEESKQKRIANAELEIATAKEHYDYLVVNDDLEKAVNEVIGVISKNIEPRN